MKTKTVIRENLTLTDEKIKSMCRLNFEDNDFLFTVENGKITDITVVSYQDDESFFVRARDTIISEIINAQSLSVSCVSGATFSSNGILEAVANALNVDFDNPNQYNSNKGGHGKGDFGKRRH